MEFIGRLFRNRNFILILAIVLGLVIGEPVAVRTEVLVLPMLALVMTLSATNITTHELSSLKSMPGIVSSSLLLNYVVMGGVTLLMAWWLIDDPDLWTGFVVMAAVPPAVAVVPFTYILGGNTLFSLIGLTGAYLAALVLMPAIMTLFLGVGFFDPFRLLLILGELVLIPIILSRILLFTGLARRINPWRGTIVNWSFFVALFTIVGLNRQAFFSEFDVLLRITIIAIVISFVLGHVIELAIKGLPMKRETSISVILMGSMKNYGLATGVLLTLFGERAAIPASICTVFGVLRLLWLSFYYRNSTIENEASFLLGERRAR
jgi:BASS family bile acid:Na+ symporter